MGEAVKIINANGSSRVSDADFEKIVAAVQLQLDLHVAPGWDRAPANLLAVPKDTQAPPGDPLIGLVDAASQPGALGWHSEDDQGRYIGEVDVDPVLDNGCGILDGGSSGISLASVFSHENIELFIDPAINVWVDGPTIDQGCSYAEEGCDPTEGSIYPMVLPDGTKVWVSNFLLPAWFDQKAKGPYDYMALCPGPFQLASGGYCVVRSAPGTEQQVFGEKLPPAWRLAMKVKGRTAKRRTKVFQPELTPLPAEDGEPTKP